MLRSIYEKKQSLLSKCCRVLIAIMFLASYVTPVQMAYGQTVLNLPVPGSMVTPTSAFEPVMLKGLTIHPENALEFDFFVYAGDSGKRGAALEEESRKLIKYFLAALTIPEDDLWVNLSPYENNRIITESFGQTEMGRDLLAQDYMLKQLSSSLMHPEEELGGEFWSEVYSQIQEQYGDVNIPVNTFNKIWIVPEEATVYQNENSAYVIDTTLKVMLEGDYVAMQKNYGNKSFGLDGVEAKEADEISAVSTEVVRSIIIPEIEKEVNEGENFANLRQIYNSMVLAAWYKQNLRESILGQVYFDRNMVKGVDVEDKEIKEKIYNQYLDAFNKGVYDIIKEEFNPITQEVMPRKYFSGGAVWNKKAVNTVRGPDLAMLPEAKRNQITTEYTRIQTGAGENKGLQLNVKMLEVGRKAQSSAVGQIGRGEAKPFGAIGVDAPEQRRDLAMNANQKKFVNRYHQDFDVAIQRAEQILSDPNYSTLINWAGLEQDLKDANINKTAQDVVSEVVAEINKGNSLKQQLSQWTAAVKTGNIYSNLDKIKIARFADDMMSSFARFNVVDQNGNMKQVDLIDGLANGDLSVEALKPTEIFDNQPAGKVEQRIKKADQYVLEGQYVPQFILAGAATRLGFGAMYALDVDGITRKRLQDINVELIDAQRDNDQEKIKSLNEETNTLTQILADPDLQEVNKVGIGPRQLMQYAATVKQIARDNGQDVDVVMAKQQPIIHINGAAEAVVLNDLIANDFYGFERENVQLITVDMYQESVVDQAGNFNTVNSGDYFPPGHGYTTEQLVVQGDNFILDVNGNKKFLPKSALDVIEEKAGEKTVLIGQHRINDMTRLTNDIIQSNFLGYAAEQVESGENFVFTKMVENRTGQKGGTSINIVDNNTGDVLLSSLVETLESKSLKALDNVLSGGHPYNTMRNIRELKKLRNIAKDGLPIYHEYKKRGMKPEMVSGDETKHPIAKTASIVESNEQIYDFKNMGTLPVLVDYARKQAEGASSDLREMMRNHKDSAMSSMTPYQRTFENRYQKDFDISVDRAEKIITNPAYYNLLNWTALTDDLKKANINMTTEAVIAQVQGEIRQGNSLKYLLSLWMSSVKANDSQAAISKIKINRFVDDIMSSFVKFSVVENGQMKEVDLVDGLAKGDLSVKALVPTDILSSQPSERIQQREQLADQYVLEGQYVPQFILAGAATRLGLGAMYTMSVEDVVGKRLEGIADEMDVARSSNDQETIDALSNERLGLDRVLNDPAFQDIKKVGIGPRQIMQYVAKVKEVARQNGQDIDEVMARQQPIIHINGAVEAEVLNDLIANDFYGFNRENVQLITVDMFQEYDVVQNGAFDIISDGEFFPPGHGYTTEQLVVEGANFVLDSQGNKQFMEKSALDIIEERAGEKTVLIGQHRVNDMVRMTNDIIQPNFLGYAIEEVQKGNHYVFTKMVENKTGQKGGTSISIVDNNTGDVLLSSLAETLESKALVALDDVLSGGHPYNTMRNIRELKKLRNIAKDGLPIYHEYKKQGMKPEMVSGDETKHPIAQTASIVEGTEAIYDFKNMDTLPVLIRFMEDQQSGASSDLRTMMASHRDAALLQDPTHKKAYVSLTTEDVWAGATDFFGNTESKRFTADDLAYKMNRPTADVTRKLGELASANTIYFDSRTNEWSLSPVGGINLDPRLLDLQIIRDDYGVPISLDKQPIFQMDIDGFVPVIINATPIINLPALMGNLDQDQDEEDLMAFYMN